MSSPDQPARGTNPLALPLIIVSIVAVAEAVALAVLLAALLRRDAAPAAPVAAAPPPPPAATATDGSPTPVPGPPAEPAAGVARGRKGERVASAGFGITVEKVSYEPTYKELSSVNEEQRYLALLVAADNDTGGNAGLFPSMFTLQDDQGYEYQPLALHLVTPALEWRTMGNRETVRGYVDFVVPKTAKGLKLVYSHLPAAGSQPIHVELGE